MNMEFPRFEIIDHIHVYYIEMFEKVVSYNMHDNN